VTRWQQIRNDIYWGYVTGLAWFTIIYIADMVTT